MIVSLVEDDPVVLTLLAEVLRAHGHEPRPILIGMDDTVETGLARIAAEIHPTEQEEIVIWSSTLSPSRRLVKNATLDHGARRDTLPPASTSRACSSAGRAAAF